MLLSLRQLKKTFSTDSGKIAGVHNVSLEVLKGEGFSLLGPSGCGKTTTLRMIAGFEVPQSGRIFFEGSDITNRPPQKRDIRTVFQKYALFPHLDVGQNIAFGLEMKGLSRDEILKKVKNMLEVIEISHLQNRKIQTLSGGEQQRVALARSLVTEPKVLLLDEPLSALDLKLRERMQLELLTLRKKLGMTFLFVTHDQTEAMVLSDRIGVMNQGKLEQVGTPLQIYQNPKTKFVASFIGQANFLSKEQASLIKRSIPSALECSVAREWVVRPEQMKLLAGEAVSADCFALPVTLMEMVFLGQNYLIKVKDATQNEYLVKCAGHQVPALGTMTDLTMQWKVEDTWVIDSGP